MYGIGCLHRGDFEMLEYSIHGWFGEVIRESVKIGSAVGSWEIKVNQ